MRVWPSDWYGLFHIEWCEECQRWVSFLLLSVVTPLSWHLLPRVWRSTQSDVLLCSIKPHTHHHLLSLLHHLLCNFIAIIITLTLSLTLTLGIRGTDFQVGLVGEDNSSSVGASNPKLFNIMEYVPMINYMKVRITHSLPPPPAAAAAPAPLRFLQDSITRHCIMWWIFKIKLILNFASFSLPPFEIFTLYSTHSLRRR